MDASTEIRTAAIADSNRELFRGLCRIALLCLCFAYFATFVRAQSYLTSTGSPSFSASYPVEMGFVDAASGNLHLEIPLGSFSQRKTGPLVPRLIYDSHIWAVPTDGASQVWTLTGNLYGLAFGTWGFSEGQETGVYNMASSNSGCNVDYMLWDESGTQRFFHIPGTLNGSTCSGGTAFATDSSGYQMKQTAWNNQGLNATLQIFAPDGTEVYGNELYPNGVAAKDSNGNYIGLTSANSLPPGINNPVIDTLGRKPAAPQSYSNPMTIQVPNSAGGYANYVVTTASIPVKTDFQEFGITECSNNCTATVITSIGLPDGTSYTFVYDCDSTTGNGACNSPGSQSGYYGTLTKMTMPTGEVVTYSYTMFGGVSWGNLHNQFPNRWLQSKSSTDGGLWQFSPVATAGAGPANNCLPNVNVGCLQTTVTRPDYSQEVTDFIVDPVGGSWPQHIYSYDTDGTVLQTINNTWDFSNLCTLNLCAGNGYQDVRKLSSSTTVTIPGGNSITKQTTYAYDTPQTGNMTAVKEWKYQNGTSPTFPSVPDRATYITYATIGTNNDINRPASITVCNSTGSSSACAAGGTMVAQTTITYDAYAGGNCSTGITSVTGVANHDDTNFGCAYTARGNATSVSQWASGSSTLTTSMTYDTTGQLLSTKDSAGNVTSYAYAPDAFYNDNGSDPGSAVTPTKPTNAYVVQVTDNIGSTTAGYYYGSGHTAFTTDYNGNATYSHFVNLSNTPDPFDRSTKTDYPIGWTLNVYTSNTQYDSYAPVGYTGAASTSCTSCVHGQSTLDRLGRTVTDSLVNNPAGQVYATYTYDALSRLTSTSHPNFGSSDPNDVSETLGYDALGRSLSVRHPDAQGSTVAYGPKVAAAGGLSSQLTSAYGVGFPFMEIDEAGKQRQEWLDGFGHVVEVDEPGSGTTQNGFATITVSGTEQTYSTLQSPGLQPAGGGTGYDHGYVQIIVNGYTAQVNYGQGSTATSVASNLVSALNASGSPVTASIQSGTCCEIYMQTKNPVATMYTFSTNSVTDVPQYVPGPSFWASPDSGTLTPMITSPNSTFYTYDGLGNLTGVIQGSQTRTWNYDGLSRLTTEATPEGGTVTLSYLNSSGAVCSGNPSNPCSRTAPAPNQTGSGTVTTTYTYDNANRLTSKAYSDSTPAVTYTYVTSAQGKGLLFTESTRYSQINYYYNTMRRITEIYPTIGNAHYTILYGYNTAGQLTSLTYPSGRVVKYNYDNVGHLCQVAAATSTSCSASTPFLTLASSQYDAAGRPLSFTYGNGVIGTVGYNPNTFAMTSLQYSKGSSVLLGLGYYYQLDSTHCPTGNAVGNNGQIQCIIDTAQPGRSASYTYDSLGRLLTAATSGSTQYPAWALSETYDRYGNRSAQAVTAGSGYNVSFNINATNNQITTYSYDASGNIISELSAAATFTYSDEECNTGYTGNGNTATYTCDTEGNRITKVVTGTNAISTVYVRGAGQVLAEYDNGAAVTSPTREYLYGNSLLATITGSTGGSGGTIVYQQRDHLSPRVYTDANGNCVGDQGTYPFGEPWYSNNDPNCTNTTGSSWIFTSYERDAESGNDYALARSYANTQGRFMTPDPLEGVVGDPQSWNRYAYVENDPINLSDPSGQGFWEDLGLVLVNIFVDTTCFECIPAMTAIDETAATAQAADLQGILVAARISITACHDADTHEPCGVPGSGGAGSGGNAGTADTNSGRTGSGNSGTVGGSGAGTTDPGQTGASGQGPGAGGASPSVTTANAGGSIWDECGTICGAIINPRVASFSAGAGSALTLGLTDLVNHFTGANKVINRSSGAYWAGAAVGTAVSIPLYSSLGALAEGKYGYLFGRGNPGAGISRGIFNQGVVRFGWGWKGTAQAGQDVIRLGIGAARGTNWWSHIIFWP